MGKYNIGLIGLAVMGENLVLNMAKKGVSVAVFNRTVDKVDKFLHARAGDLPICGAHSMEEFINMLEKPRKIMLMVKAGKPVDDMLECMLRYLEPGDIIIDGGNSFYQDTRRRYSLLEAKGMHYIGMGVSGGEEGALNGPSLMPGGDKGAYQAVAEIFTKIAAKVSDGVCCSYVGPDGAGHYVKMVHNGIEYGDMQLISEAYFILKEILGLTINEIQAVFASWNQGELNSYLIEITSTIMSVCDTETGLPLVEVILDKAGQKGTGKWTSQSALELGVPTPTITAAVFARCISAFKKERLAASEMLLGPEKKIVKDKEKFITAVHDALYASKICSYAQGFALLKAASDKYNWQLNYGDIALLWRGGCIIRAGFLERINKAFANHPELPNLMLDAYFQQALLAAQQNWRRVVAVCKQQGVPIMGFSASLDYYDAYRQAVLPANLIQAQRDYFGAHTYERIDRPGVFHTDWLGKN